MSAADASSPMPERPSQREVLAHLLEPKLRIQDTEPVLGLRCNGRHGVALGPLPGYAQGGVRLPRQVGPAGPVVAGDPVGVEDPALAGFSAPLGGEVLGGLVDVVSYDVDVAGFLGPGSWPRTPTPARHRRPARGPGPPSPPAFDER